MNRAFLGIVTQAGRSQRQSEFRLLLTTAREFTLLYRAFAVRGTTSRPLSTTRINATSSDAASQPSQTPRKGGVGMLNKLTFGPRISRFLKTIFKRYVPQYEAYHIGRNLYKTTFSLHQLHEEGERKQQQKIVSDKIVGDKASLVLPGFWLKDANLPSTFQTWFSVQALYIWMLMVRLRAIPHYKHYSQELVDNWFLDAEARIKAAGIRSSKVVNDTLKDLVSSFRGAVLAYDEGLVKGDAVLASAVWRNLLGTTDDDVLPEVMLDVLVFIRKQLTMLNQVTDQDFILGNFRFDEIVSSTKGDGVS